jgi:sulfotransferase famil protein
VIISHKHKFIFIKTEKTAGTSVEIALSRFCGDEDVITPVTPEDEAIRRSAGARGPQNYRIPLKAYTLKDWGRLALKRRRACFFNHASAAFIREHLDDECWSSYFKFCFERNPWDKVVSWYYWRHPREPRPSLSEFVRSGKADTIRSVDLYTIDGTVVVDRVCRFENIEQEMDEVARIIGLPAPPELPKAKAGYRANGNGYRAVLSQQDREGIANAYAREIAHLGYVW